MHVLSHCVATTARSGSPSEQVVSRRRISICGSERQDILLYENSCKPFMVESRKGSSSGTFLPQERGASVISPPPPPLHAFIVQDKDVEFVIQDLSKGDSLGEYAPLRTHDSDFLCRERVHTQASGKQRMVHNYRYLNSFCKKQTCRYEQVKDLHKLLRPRDWLLSLDVSAVYWHVPLHPATVHYLSFHLALPASYVNVSGRTVQVPLQPGAYWALPHGSPGQYQVVERTCAVLPFGYTNAPFIWTKVVKVLARAMRARRIRCLWFIDDCLLVLPSRPLALLERKTVEDLFVRSGLTRVPDKGVWVPTQTLPDHLGVEISTASATG
jgi:hypothetical protein